MKNLCFILVLTLSLGLSAKLPSDFKTCKAADKNFESCLREAINNAVLKLKDGIPSLNIPSLDPLLVPSMSIGEGKGAVHVVQSFKNINLHGASEGKVTKIDGSKINDLILYVESLVPLLTLNAEYSLDGRILLLPIQGEGDCTITLENVNVTHWSSGERIVKKGKEYMRIKQYTITLEPKKVHFDFKNLFNGDKLLGESTSIILNENWFEVFSDVKPGYEQSLGIIFGDYANKFYSKVPLNELFGI